MRHPSRASLTSLTRNYGSSTLSQATALPDLSTLVTLRRAAFTLGQRTHPTSSKNSSDSLWDFDCAVATAAYARIVLNKWLWAEEIFVQVCM